MMEGKYMATAQTPVSELLVIAKSREIQRGMFAEMSKTPKRAAPHFLAAAHLELVLADDYAAAGQQRLAFRSKISAASCLWRAGEIKRARALFTAISNEHPGKAKFVKSTVAELEGKQA
jgi:hypothetical protein